MCVVSLQQLFFVVIIASLSNGQQADISALEIQLREEAPQGWKHLESKHRETRFDWKETEINNSGDEQKVRTTTGSNCYRGEDFLIQIGEERRTIVWGGNDRSLFAVSRKSDDYPWVLGQFGSRTYGPEQNGDWEYGLQPRIPWRIYNVPCRTLIADPSFMVHRLEKKPDGSVELRFALSPRNGPDGYPQLTSGRALLLPDQDWAISSYVANLTRPTRPDDPPVIVSAAVTYGPEKDRFLNLSHSTYELRWQTDGKQRGTKWERDWTCQHCDKPVESFSLASFGVPEPVLLDVENAKSKTWLWLNVIAIVCLLVALILRSRLTVHDEN